MKRCPTCNRTYTEQNLSYCIDDGTPLASVGDDETTVVSPKDTAETQTDWNAVAYRPPTAYAPPTPGPRRRVWPWIVGLLAFVLIAFIGLAFAAWIIVPKLVRDSANRNVNIGDNSNLERRTGPVRPVNPNSNDSNSNSAELNDNTTLGNTNTDAPRDREQVLAQLTDLEHEWTVANINADKKKLEVILADDYVGPGPDGQMQGKREYIRDIQRDTSIETWEFRDLKLTLHGDRATLNGRVNLRTNNGDQLYDFVDKFVWRDGRWQATGSTVSVAD